MLHDFCGERGIFQHRLSCHQLPDCQYKYTIKTTWFLAQYWPVQTMCNYMKYNMLQTNNYSVSVTDSMGLNLILSPSTLYSTVER